MRKKILILYTSVGLGHKTIAENIGWHLAQDGYEVKLFDVLKLQAGPLVTVSTATHQFINRRLPFMWKWMYTSRRLTDITLSGRVKVASRNYLQVKQAIDEFQPDLVITTQTIASAIVEYIKQKGWYQGLFAVAFSDYHLHRHWLYPSVDLYLANIVEQKDQMIMLGVPRENIAVIGMTLLPRPEIEVDDVREKLHIKPGERVVLAASGSLGTGLSPSWFVNMSQEVSRLDKTRFIILCGKNEQLAARLRLDIKEPATIILGYYSPLSELYAIADLFLTKPGGLSVAEALQWNLPMLITHWLPGQEEINHEYLASRHMVMERPQDVSPSALLPLIRDELDAPNFRRSLVDNDPSLEITQAGHEGGAVKTAVKQAFHKFDR